VQISDLDIVSKTCINALNKQPQSGATGKTGSLSLKRQRTSELLAASQGFFVPAIDEFGGYSSRLRIPEMLSSKQEERTANTACT